MERGITNGHTTYSRCPVAGQAGLADSDLDLQCRYARYGRLCNETADARSWHEYLGRGDPLASLDFQLLLLYVPQHH